jgi:hypothetical protein
MMEGRREGGREKKRKEGRKEGWLPGSRLCSEAVRKCQTLIKAETCKANAQFGQVERWSYLLWAELSQTPVKWEPWKLGPASGHVHLESGLCS